MIYNIVCLIIVLMLFIALCIYYNLLKNQKNNKIYNDTTIEKNYTNIYSRDYFMSRCELEFYHKIKLLENKYHIVPQFCLGSIFNKKNGGNMNELHKYIDFAIFNKEYTKLLLLIELNDSSHKEPNRIKRDIMVRKICKDFNIKLITFYTIDSNYKWDIIERIKYEIEN